MKEVTRIKFVSFGMRYSKFGSHTYMENVIRELRRLGCSVEEYSMNRYAGHKISPVFSLIAAIRLILMPWWRYDYVLANDGSGAFLVSPRKIVIMHHTQREEMRVAGVSLAGVIGWFLQRMAICTSYAVICISNMTRSHVEPYASGTPIGTIWNGVDHNVYRVLPGDQKHALGLDDKLTLAYASRSSGHKNLDALIRLVHLINLPLNLVILGGEIPASLRKRIMHNPNVTLVNPGYVEVETLVKYINAADFYTNVSRFEGFGLVQVEAMACGTYVVAFDTGENSQILGAGGRVVANLDEMSKFVRELWADKDLLRKRKDDAVARARQFSWENTARKIMKFLHIETPQPVE